MFTLFLILIAPQAARCLSCNMQIQFSPPVTAIKASRMPDSSGTKCDRLSVALEAPVFNFPPRQRQEGTRTDPSRTAGEGFQQNGTLSIIWQNTHKTQMCGLKVLSVNFAVVVVVFYVAWKLDCTTKKQYPPPPTHPPKKSKNEEVGQTSVINVWAFYLGKVFVHVSLLFSVEWTWNMFQMFR